VARNQLFGLSEADQSAAAIGSNWAMEGQNPHRDRTTTDQLTLPLKMAQEIEIGGETQFGSPVGVADGLIFVESLQKLHALSLDGQEQWNFHLPGFFVSPTIADNHVFVRAESGDAGYLTAIRADTGLRQWEFRFPRVGSSNDNIGGHVTSPVVANGLVLVGADHFLRAFDAQTGEEQWVYDLEEAITSSASIAGDLIFFTDLNYLYAVDLNTGAEHWRFHSGDFSLSFAPVVIDDLVITTNQDIAFALNRVDGEISWSRKLPAETVIPGGAAGDKVYIKSANQLFALDRGTGSELWSFRVTDFISLPAIATGQIFVISRSGGQAKLHALDIENGQELWQVENTRLSNAAPVVAGGQLYVRTVDGSVLVYRN
jgi:outer membrane protein assembly factor BamB